MDSYRGLFASDLDRGEGSAVISGTVAQMGMFGIDTIGLGSQLGWILRNSQPSSGGNWGKILTSKIPSRSRHSAHLVPECPEFEFPGHGLFPLDSHTGPAIQHRCFCCTVRRWHSWRVDVNRGGPEGRGHCVTHLLIFQNDNNSEVLRKGISSSRHFLIPLFRPSFCIYGATFKELGVTCPTRVNAGEEIVFYSISVTFCARFG